MISIYCLDYNEFLEIRMFHNQFFAHGCIILITSPTRVTSKIVSLVDNIFTNFTFDTSVKLKNGIIKNVMFLTLFLYLIIHQKFINKIKRVVCTKCMVLN